MHIPNFFPDVPTRFAIVPRRGNTSDIRWFEADPTYVLHWINAYEDGDEIVLDGFFQHRPMPTKRDGDSKMMSLYRYVDLDQLQARPHRWRFNLVTGETKEEPLSDRVMEFGMINGTVGGQPYRYSYNMTGKPGWFLFDGLVKQDLQTGAEDVYRFGDGVFGERDAVRTPPERDGRGRRLPDHLHHRRRARPVGVPRLRRDPTQRGAHRPGPPARAHLVGHSLVLDPGSRAGWSDRAPGHEFRLRFAAVTPNPRRNSETRVGPNAIGATLGLLGDEWSLLIVRHALAGARRFGDWRSQVGISDAVLSGRLRSLVDGGVLERVRYSQRPPRDEYVLTESGRELWPVLVAIWSWERRFVPGRDQELPELVHRGCGQVAHPELRCGTCEARVTADAVELTLGPSGAFDRSAPVSAYRRRPGTFRATMEVIGSRWSAAPLGAAFLGATRFSEFERMLGAPPTVVAERLQRFVDLGVLGVDDAEGERAGYRLTEKGAALFDVVATMLRWGERWKGAPDGPAVLATHGEDAHLFLPELACSACGEALAATAIRVVPEDRFRSGVGTSDG